MTTSAGDLDGPRRDGLVRALEGLRSLARTQAEEVLASLPDTGDPVTGRAADDLVEQVGDALRALDETVALTLRRLGESTSPGTGMPPRHARHAAYGSGHPMPPGARRQDDDR